MERLGGVVGVVISLIDFFEGFCEDFIVGFRDFNELSRARYIFVLVFIFWV